jgi:hypothetical protein
LGCEAVQLAGVYVELDLICWLDWNRSVFVANRALAATVRNLTLEGLKNDYAMVAHSRTVSDRLPDRFLPALTRQHVRGEVLPAQRLREGDPVDDKDIPKKTSETTDETINVSIVPETGISALHLLTTNRAHYAEGFADGLKEGFAFITAGFIALAIARWLTRNVTE